MVSRLVVSEGLATAANVALDLLLVGRWAPPVPP